MDIDAIYNKLKNASNEIIYVVNSLNLNEYFETLKDCLDALGPIKAVYTIGMTFKAKHDLKNFKNFFEKLQNANITKEELEEYASKNLKNKKDIQNEVEKVILLLTELTDETKSDILGNLYINLIRGNINYNEFKTYCELLNNFIVADSNTLKELIENKPTFHDKYEKYHSAARLISLGLIYDSATFWIDNNNVPRFIITEDGEKFYKYGLIEAK